MNQFEAALRREIEQAQQSLTTTEPADDGQFDQHRGRLRDLLDVATRAGVDTSGWLSPEVHLLLAGD
jgi:hypothetical protein